MSIAKQLKVKSTRVRTQVLFAAILLACGVSMANAGVVRVINVDMNFNSFGPTGPTYSGKGAVEQLYGTYWNGLSVSSATGLLDSQGYVSPVSWSGSGANGGFDDGGANSLHSDRLYNNVGESANWGFGGFQVGLPVDLYFFGNINTTFEADTGIEEGTVSAAITSGTLMTLAAPDHSDWIEGTHYAHLRVTPTTTFVSGTYFNLSAQSAFSGVQIVGVTAIPEPSTFMLFGFGVFVVRYARKFRRR